jgi:hypothetical protein
VECPNSAEYALSPSAAAVVVAAPDAGAADRPGTADDGDLVERAVTPSAANPWRTAEFGAAVQAGEIAGGVEFPAAVASANAEESRRNAKSAPVALIANGAYVADPTDVWTTSDVAAFADGAAFTVAAASARVTPVVRTERSRRAGESCSEQ